MKNVAGAIALAVLLAACGGGGGASGGSAGSGNVNPGPPVQPTPTPTAPGPSQQTITTAAGSTAGAPGAYNPDFGDTATGGQGNPVDGIPCVASMSENYHVHIYLMVINNGTQVALPAGSGMFDPQPPQAGFVNLANCFYYLHTHDASGIVHVEDPNQSGAPVTASLYTLKSYLDVWGITADGTHFGPYSGPVRVFTSGQVYNGQQRTVQASSYTFYGTDPTSVPLYSHEVIVVEIGPTYPSTVPNVTFYMTN